MKLRIIIGKLQRNSFLHLSDYNYCIFNPKTDVLNAQGIDMGEGIDYASSGVDIDLEGHAVSSLIGALGTLLGFLEQLEHL